MRSDRQKPRLALTVEGLLRMRLRSLGAGRSLLRFAIAFGIVIALALLAGDEQAAHEYWSTVLTLFVTGFLPLYCLAKGGEAARAALREGTMEFLWTRPAGRGQLYFGFYCGALLANLALVGCCLLALTVAALALGTVGSLPGVVLLWLVSGLAVATFTALSMLLAAWSSKFVALGIVYFLVVEVGLGSLPTQVSALSVSAHARAALAPLASVGERWSDTPLFGSTLGMLLIGVLALMAGAAVFVGSRYVVGSDKEA